MSSWRRGDSNGLCGRLPEPTWSRDHERNAYLPEAITESEGYRVLDGVEELLPKACRASDIPPLVRLVVSSFGPALTPAGTVRAYAAPSAGPSPRAAMYVRARRLSLEEGAKQSLYGWTCGAFHVAAGRAQIGAVA